MRHQDDVSAAVTVGNVVMVLDDRRRSFPRLKKFRCERQRTTCRVRRPRGGACKDVSREMQTPVRGLGATYRAG